MIYRFQDFTLDTQQRELRCGAVLRPVEPQVFDLLEYLIRNRERVVSKDEVFRAIWRERVVSDSVLSTRINAARSAIGDNGVEQRLIRTLRTKGIRFVGVVHEQKKVLRNSANPVSEGLAWRPAIAVLPFTNISGDPKQDYFADGITEELIAVLSKSDWLHVTSRNSSFAYKGKLIATSQIARKLGVRYVLEGGVRQAAGQVRVTVQL